MNSVQGDHVGLPERSGTGFFPFPAHIPPTGNRRGYPRRSFQKRFSSSRKNMSDTVNPDLRICETAGQRAIFISRSFSPDRISYSAFSSE